MKLTVELPSLTSGITRRVLSPNGRAFYMKLALAKQTAKLESANATREALGFKPGYFHPLFKNPEIAAQLSIMVSIDAAYRGAGSADADNVIAMLKASFDGIASALGVDDKCFVMGTVTLKEERKAMHFRIHIEW